VKVTVGEIEITVGNRKRGDVGVYVGRPSILGNPYTLSKGRFSAIAQYREWLREKITTRDLVVCGALERLRQRAIRDKKLALVCWCAPLACHAEVIADELAKVLSSGRGFMEKVVEVGDGGGPSAKAAE
jgi:hypothetical protein